MLIGMTAYPQSTMVKMPASRLPEITGPHIEFAELVRRITGQVTRRQAEIRSGVNHDTIARMWRGDRVQEAQIIRFAIGYQVDPNPLLEAAGYPLLPDRQSSTPQVASRIMGVGGLGLFRGGLVPGTGLSSGEIERERDPEANQPEEDSRLKWIAAYDNLPIKIRESMLQQAEAILILDEAYRERTDIVGKKAKD